MTRRMAEGILWMIMTAIMITINGFTIEYGLISFVTLITGVFCAMKALHLTDAFSEEDKEGL